MPDIFKKGVNLCEQLPTDNCVINDPTGLAAVDPSAFPNEGVVAAADVVAVADANDDGDGDPSIASVSSIIDASKIPPLDTHPNAVTQQPTLL